MLDCGFVYRPLGEQERGGSSASALVAMSGAHDRQMTRRRRAAAFIPLLLAWGVWVVLSALALFRYPHSLWLVELPVPIAAACAILAHYRFSHGFWPWDRRRRKIERWRWLVEGTDVATPAARRSAVGAIFVLVVLLATISTLTAALLS
jgi:hypothetical protein